LAALQHEFIRRSALVGMRSKLLFREIEGHNRRSGLVC
jgi:hypothetical protein